MAEASQACTNNIRLMIISVGVVEQGPEEKDRGGLESDLGQHGGPFREAALLKATFQCL